MPRTITPGTWKFEKIHQNNNFYIDKTKFIKQWWNSKIDVTLITRPRRFGKTLMLDTIKTFFSPEYSGRIDLFEDLEIWKDGQLRKYQGKIPVIFISFSDLKGIDYIDIINLIKYTIIEIYDSFKKKLNLDDFTDTEIEQLKAVNRSMDNATAQTALRHLSKYLMRQYNVEPIILLDEYDKPLQEAWLYGYWDKLIVFLQGFFNSTFKTNPYLGRSLITGLTRVAKESLFSDLNSLQVVSTTSDLYTDCFGFTEEEVFAAMDEYELTNKEEVKYWYDGFIFGKQKEIYNPWSVIEFILNRKLNYYWADTSSNRLVGEVIAHGDKKIKKEVEKLLQKKSITAILDEQITFSQLYTKEGAIWSLLLALGYVKPLHFNQITKEYELVLTNFECYVILEDQIFAWFGRVREEKNEFIQALLANDLVQMNEQMQYIAENIFSFFDTGKTTTTSENFYHAFVLGLILDLKETYNIISNRESGYGRYDLCLFPNEQSNPGIVIEFKTLNKNEEKNLRATCRNALLQIKEKKYVCELLAHNVSSKNIYVYGFAFKGKDVFIAGGEVENIDAILEHITLRRVSRPLGRPLKRSFF